MKLIKYTIVSFAAFAVVSIFAANLNLAKSPKSITHVTGIYVNSQNTIPIDFKLQFAGQSCSNTSSIDLGVHSMSSGYVAYDGDWLTSFASNCNSLTITYIDTNDNSETSEFMTLTWDGQTYSYSNPFSTTVTIN